MDTVEANHHLGFKADLRDYGIGAQVLAHLGLKKICLLTNNPKKIIGLQGYGLEVVGREPLETEPCEHNSAYLKTKKAKMGHILKRYKVVLRAVKKTKAKPHAQKAPKVAVVMSLFNEDINNNLLQGLKAAFLECQIPEKNLDVYTVSGAFEIPFLAKKVALKKKHQGMVVIGSVIRGATPHFEYVSQAVTMGSLRASLDAMMPLSFAVITVDNLEQALERSGNNSFNKGREAAFALMKTLETLESI